MYVRKEDMADVRNFTGTRRVTLERGLDGVAIVDVRIPFRSMVVLLVKGFLASLLAGVLLFLLVNLTMTVLGLSVIGLAGLFAGL